MSVRLATTQHDDGTTTVRRIGLTEHPQYGEKVWTGTTVDAIRRTAVHRLTHPENKAGDTLERMEAEAVADWCS